MNVDVFLVVGNTKVEKIEGKDVFKDSLKRREKVKILSTKTYVKLNRKGDPIIDFYFCFKGLAKVSKVNFKDCKGHELCANPPALFESTSLMQKADKSTLATTIADFVKINIMLL